ncbi:hypothetical protein [Gracilinema caldarium]|uniref:hypothetical protein n=1 Tax=Gracilinema caldarium TaxID=215591 RepID=UPI0026EC5F14|nr:hypothetical protein [Gracilinema caldarium]
MFESDVFIGQDKIGKVIISSYSPKLDRWFGYVELSKEYGYAGNPYYIIDGKDGKKVKIITMSTPLFLTTSALVQME